MMDRKFVAAAIDAVFCQTALHSSMAKGKGQKNWRRFGRSDR